MDPFGIKQLDVVAVDDRGRESHLKASGLRIETGRGTGIHLGFHERCVHVMARGQVTRTKRIGGRRAWLALAYMQLLVNPEPWGTSFEVRPMGEMKRQLPTALQRVAVVGKDMRSRAVQYRQFIFRPMPSCPIRIDIKDFEGRVTVALSVPSDQLAKSRGGWQQAPSLFLHMPGWNFVRVIPQMLRMIPLEELRRRRARRHPAADGDAI